MNSYKANQNPSSRESLFDLLPAFHRSLDTAVGSPLQALTGIMQAQLDTIDRNVAQLYDDWFIETCQDWVAPYIGNLVGLDRLLGAGAAALPVRRALVADLIAFSRRKGTVHVLQPLAFSATGYPARAVEAWPLLVATQNVAAVRPGRGGTVDVSSLAPLGSLGTSQDSLAHRLEVGAIAQDRYGLNTIALFLWRLIAFPMEGVVPAPGPQIKGGMPTFWFDPLGRDLPLLAPPSEPPPVDRPAGPQALPLPITRQLLALDLAAFQRRWSNAPPASAPPDSLFYGPGRGLVVQTGRTVLGPLDVASADLASWQPPAAPAASAYIDPERGRVLVAGTAPVQVNYGYGLAAPIGGGPYERRGRMTRPGDVRWTITVGSGGDVADLAAAVAAWSNAAPATALIAILDSATYTLPGLGVAMPQGGRLVIEAADQQRPALVMTAPVTVSGGGAALVLSGLLMQATVALGSATRLIVEDCTLIPPPPLKNSAPVPAIMPNAAGGDIAVTIRSSIVGPIALPAQNFLTLADSVVDAFGTACAIGDAGGPKRRPSGPVFDLVRTSVIGAALSERIEQAADAIFLGPLTVADRASNPILYSHIAPGSQVPPLWRCQPELALADAASELGLSGPDQLPPEVRAAVIAAVAPRFASLVLPASGYAQFAPDCPRQISAGAADGGGMGALNLLQAAQHENVLRILCERFAPVGRKVGLYFAT